MFSIYYIALIATILLLLAISSCATISTEDFVYMKSTSEQLLKIDSASCKPELLRMFGMRRCYELAYYNAKYKKYVVKLDTIIAESYTPYKTVNHMFVRDSSRTRHYYILRYRLYDGNKPTKKVINFEFEKDSITKKLYCNDVIINSGPHRLYHEIYKEDDDDD